MVALSMGVAAQVVPHRLVMAVPLFVYLVAVPSLIGCPLFTSLLSEVPVHVANTESCIAPVIALGLGWLLLAEEVTPCTVGEVAVILLGVAVMVLGNSRSHRAAEVEPEPLVEFEELAA